MEVGVKRVRCILSKRNAQRAEAAAICLGIKQISQKRIIDKMLVSLNEKRVAYVSDCTVLADCEGKGLSQMVEYFPENPRDYVEDHGEDVGSLFVCFKGCEWYLPTEDDPEGEYLHPYTGSLDQEAVVYRYVVNETRKEYLDRFHGRHLCTVDGVDILEDVTPALLGDTGRLERKGEEALDGIWVGDVITPTNDAPGEGCIDITPEYAIWP